MRLSRRKRAVFATLLVIASSLAGVAVIELGLRALLPYYFSDESRLANLPGRYRYRNAHADVLVEINRFGLRGPEPAAAKAAGTVRVLAIGDSTTWGEMLEFEDTYSEVAARILNAAGGPRYEFLNLSRPGAGLLQYLDYWRQAGSKLHPDVVVIGFFVGNDFYSVALAVKIEVDTRPPAGAGLATTVVRRHAVLQIQHHDQASLLAGKLHAVLQRPFPKGRDFYDLIWYLGDRSWPPPNLRMLNNALRQTGWSGKPLTDATWRAAVRRRLQDLPWERLASDVRPFLEDPADRALLSRGTLQGLLRRKAERK